MRAIFLDRDGTINYPVLNPTTDEYEAPHLPEDLKLYPFVISSLKQMQEKGYYLFLVSNQPDFAKGKNTMENILAVKDKFNEILIKNGIYFKDYYYCYHHPSVSVCECRKPNPFFIKKAANEYDLNLKKSWMIGDRNADIICGIEAGTKTIHIGTEKSTISDFSAENLKEAAEIINFCDNIRKRK